MAEKRLLLADADAHVGAEFRRVLGDRWEIVIVADGEAALAEFQQGAFDVLVADFDLPGLDSADLLNRVGREQPKVIRFILVSPNDKEHGITAVVGPHHFLTKPLNEATLRDSIDRAVALNVWLANDKLRELVARVRSFPVIPSLYVEVLHALQSPGVTTGQVGAIIAKDMAMMTKLLQALNSACFGLPLGVRDAADAVTILGFEAVKSMVITIKLLNEFEKIKPLYFSIDRLWRHSTAVAQSAKALVLQQTDDNALAEAAFAAGLLHDVGKVVLAANFEEDHRRAQSLAAQRKVPLEEVEREIFGASHAEVGAYLLAWWGMPIELLEAAAWHHHPSRCSIKGLTPLAAVHVANALEHEVRPDAEGLVASPVDEEFLAESGLLDLLAGWRLTVINQPRNDTELIHKQKAVANELRAESRAAGAGRWFTWKRVGYAGAAILMVLMGGLGVEWLSGQSQPQPGDSQESISRMERMMAAIQSKRLFRKYVQKTAETNATALVAAASPGPAADTNGPPAPDAGFKLQAIFFSTNHPTAMINGETVGLNDHLDEAVVLAIDRLSVTLESKKQRIVLALER